MLSATEGSMGADCRQSESPYFVQRPDTPHLRRMSDQKADGRKLHLATVGFPAVLLGPRIRPTNANRWADHCGRDCGVNALIKRRLFAQSPISAAPRCPTLT